MSEPAAEPAAPQPVPAADADEEEEQEGSEGEDASEEEEEEEEEEDPDLAPVELTPDGYPLPEDEQEERLLGELRLHRGDPLWTADNAEAFLHEQELYDDLSEEEPPDTNYKPAPGEYPPRQEYYLTGYTDPREETDAYKSDGIGLVEVQAGRIYDGTRVVPGAVALIPLVHRVVYAFVSRVVDIYTHFVEESALMTSYLPVLYGTWGHVQKYGGVAAVLAGSYILAPRGRKPNLLAIAFPWLPPLIAYEFTPGLPAERQVDSVYSTHNDYADWEIPYPSYVDPDRQFIESYIGQEESFPLLHDAYDTEPDDD
jgi:hypothetical protein